MIAGWRRLIGPPKLHIIFHKRATKYRSLLRKMIYKDKGSYESWPLCILHTPYTYPIQIPHTHTPYTYPIHIPYTHTLYTYPIHIPYTHTPYTYPIHIPHTHTPYTYPLHIPHLHRGFTAYCIWSVISQISKMIRFSCSLCLFCHVPLKSDKLD